MLRFACPVLLRASGNYDGLSDLQRLDLIKKLHRPFAATNCGGGANEHVEIQAFIARRQAVGVAFPDRRSGLGLVPKVAANALFFDFVYYVSRDHWLFVFHWYAIA